MGRQTRIDRAVDHRPREVSAGELDKLCRFALVGASAYMGDAGSLDELRERRRSFRKIRDLCRVNLVEHPEFNAALGKAERAYKRRKWELSDRG
jgi:hypothetical protein